MPEVAKPWARLRPRVPGTISEIACTPVASFYLLSSSSRCEVFSATRTRHRRSGRAAAQRMSAAIKTLLRP